MCQCILLYFCMHNIVNGLNQSKALISVEQNVTEYNVEYYKNNRQYTNSVGYCRSMKQEISKCLQIIVW